jgi:hypothetical protein
MRQIEEVSYDFRPDTHTLYEAMPHNMKRHMWRSPQHGSIQMRSFLIHTLSEEKEDVPETE